MSKHKVLVEIGFDGHTEQADAEQAIFELLNDAVNNPQWKAHGTYFLSVSGLEVTPR